MITTLLNKIDNIDRECTKLVRLKVTIEKIMLNTKQNYGWITISLHWIVAISVLGLFSLGYWMVTLTYYDVWYESAPAIHKSIGIILFIMMIVRSYFRLTQAKPIALPSHSKIEKILGRITHIFLYLLLFAIMLSGYLISTADGRGIEVFNIFTVPSVGPFMKDQEDVAGIIHKYLAYTMIALVLLHALAALKHHFIDRDTTLTRMLGRR